MPARSRPNRSFRDQVMGVSEKPRDQDSLAYKVTIFYGPGLSASGIGYSETEALVAANKQIPTGAKRTGRHTERIFVNSRKEQTG